MCNKKRDGAIKHDSQKLTKLMMFKMAKECELLTCNKCGFEITDWERIGLDHIKPWRQEEDPEKARELFWDLNNLAFVHKGCNVNDHKLGTSKSGYISVYSTGYKSPDSKKYKAKTKTKLSLGTYYKAEAAAMARDMSIVRDNDRGIFNFPQLIDWYKETVERYPSYKDWSFLDEVCDKVLQERL